MKALPDTAPMPTPPPALPQAADLPGIRDIKGVIVQPEMNPLWFWLAGGLLLIVLTAALIIYLKKRRQKIQVQQAHEKALQDLEAARALMTPDQARTFAVTLADILRRYIENRFQLSMQHLTTREFLKELMHKQGAARPELQKHDKMLNEWLTHCDLVKFARYSLTEDEMKQMFSSVSDFITATRVLDNRS